ncbi:hypothetical protein JYU14_01580 [Simkania negevensis]|uniref:Uncharacterized protein n=1 Tax=Simkania negevensis TaxID=83561 RepID=A0ABS3AUV4_9BACT|nr:hypothetical protein [Simkania negevensis]
MDPPPPPQGATTPINFDGGLDSKDRHPLTKWMGEGEKKYRLLKDGNDQPVGFQLESTGQTFTVRNVNSKGENVGYLGSTEMLNVAVKTFLMGQEKIIKNLTERQLISDKGFFSHDVSIIINPDKKIIEIAGSILNKTIEIEDALTDLQWMFYQKQLSNEIPRAKVETLATKPTSYQGIPRSQGNKTSYLAPAVTALSLLCSKELDKSPTDLSKAVVAIGTKVKRPSGTTPSVTTKEVETLLAESAVTNKWTNKPKKGKNAEKYFDFLVSQLPEVQTALPTEQRGTHLIDIAANALTDKSKIQEAIISRSRARFRETTTLLPVHVTGLDGTKKIAPPPARLEIPADSSKPRENLAIFDLVMTTCAEGGNDNQYTNYILREGKWSKYEDDKVTLCQKKEMEAAVESKGLILFYARA